MKPILKPVESCSNCKFFKFAEWYEPGKTKLEYTCSKFETVENADPYSFVCENFERKQ